jgi:chaperonin cofactor prefoldin
MEAGLSAQAQTQGMSLNAFLQSVIEKITVQGSATDLSLEEFEAGLDELAAASDNLPVLPAEAYSRDSIYGDG